MPLFFSFSIMFVLLLALVLGLTYKSCCRWISLALCTNNVMCSVEASSGGFRLKQQ